MKFGPSKGHPVFIFENFIKDFGLLLILLPFSLFVGTEKLDNYISLFAIGLFSPIKRCIKYFSTYYSIDEYKMSVQTGVFTKKKIEIPLEAITTVDFAQNILHQIFDVYRLKIDNASQTNDFGKTAEISITLGKEQALLVKKLLMSKKNTNEDTVAETGNNDASKSFTIKSKMQDFILLGLFQSKLAYIIGILPVVFGIFSFIVSKITGETDIEKFLDNIEGSFLPPFIILSVLSIYVIGSVSSTILTIIKYYNFRITDRGNSLYIEFGLFTKKTYTLMKEKISGIEVKQSLLMRVFGFATADVFVIGYGDSSEEEGQELAMLYPIFKLNKFENMLLKILPEILLKGTYKKPQKKAFRYFFICPRFIFSVVLLIGTCFSKTWYIIAIAAILVLLAGISVILEYKNTGLLANTNTVSFSGGGFKRHIKYIKTEKIESITEYGFTRKRKKGITSISLGFLSPLRVSDAKVKNVSFEDFRAITSVLKF